MKNNINKIPRHEDMLMYDRALKNFIKGVAKNKFAMRLNSYPVLYAFLKKFDSNVKLSHSNFNNLQKRNTSFKLFTQTPKTKKFIEYIQNFEPSFKESMILPENMDPDLNKEVHINTPSKSNKHSDIYKYSDKNILTKKYNPVKYHEIHTSSILFKKVSTQDSAKTDKSSDTKRGVKTLEKTIKPKKSIKTKDIDSKKSIKEKPIKVKKSSKLKDVESKKSIKEKPIKSQKSIKKKLTEKSIQDFYFEPSNKKLNFNLVIYNKYDVNNHLALAIVYDRYG
jgi:hypothetical protein